MRIGLTISAGVLLATCLALSGSCRTRTLIGDWEHGNNPAGGNNGNGGAPGNESSGGHFVLPRGSGGDQTTCSYVNRIALPRPANAPAFAAAVDYPVSGSPVFAGLADLDGNGSLDVGVVTMFSMNSGGMPAPSVGRPTGGSGSGGAGPPDYSTFVALPNDGHGGLGPLARYSLGTNGEAAAFGDLDGDGRTDIAVTSGARSFGSVTVLLQDATGGFSAPTIYASGGGSKAVAMADVNGDGHQDLVVLISPGVAVLVNDGTGSFVTHTYPAAVASKMAVVDIDGDGDVDVVISGNIVSKLANRGDGVLGAQVDLVTGTYPDSFAVGDVNGDGQPDIAMASGSGYNVSVAINLGDGSFATPVSHLAGAPSPVGNSIYSMTIADLNHDGQPDLLFGDALCPVFGVLLNQGSGAFGEPIYYGTDGQPPVVGDLDGDGVPDLVVPTSSGVSVLLNRTP